MRRSTAAAMLSLGVFATPGCESKDKGANALEQIASTSPALAAQPAPPSIPAASPKKVVRRPQQPGEMLVTDERRQMIEREHPEAAGFLSAATIEEQLFKLEIPRGQDAKAQQAFDRIAKGKWVLFTGHITNAQPDSFELAVRYTPRDQADPMGVTSQWLPIKLSQVRGYDASEYRPGELAAAVARYNGDRQAAPGFDLVLLGHWYVD